MTPRFNTRSLATRLILGSAVWIVAALVVGVEESAMHDALNPVEAANVIHAVTRISPLLHAAMGKQSVVDAAVRCLVDKSQTMDRRCVALSLDAATRLRLSD